MEENTDKHQGRRRIRRRIPRQEEVTRRRRRRVACDVERLHLNCCTQSMIFLSVLLLLLLLHYIALHKVSLGKALQSTRPTRYFPLPTPSAIHISREQQQQSTHGHGCRLERTSSRVNDGAMWSEMRENFNGM